MKIGLPVFEAWRCWNGFMIAIFFAVFSVPARAEDKTDVTTVVSAAVKEDKLSIAASNETFDDTAPGVPKKLTVEYRIGDKELKAETNERKRKDRHRRTGRRETAHHQGGLRTGGRLKARKP